MHKCFFLSILNAMYSLSLFTYGDDASSKYLVSIHLNKCILSDLLVLFLSVEFVYFGYIVVGPSPVVCSRVIGMQCFGAVMTIFEVPS